MKKWYFFVILVVLLILAFFLFFSQGSKNKQVLKQEQQQVDAINTIEKDKLENSKISPISGFICKNYNKRPIAIVLAGDQVVRPLSGISDADLVLEIPVVKNGINRLLAVYVCEEPLEIGSIRSARHDFIPLAKGFDAVLVHWGGSHFALDELKKGLLNNIDAIYLENRFFYRKQGIPKPHNGFTSMQRINTAMDEFKYRETNKFEPYPHSSSITMDNNFEIANKIFINYPYSSAVRYEYDFKMNKYWRFRGNDPEIDRNNGKQIKAGVVAVLRTKIKNLEGQYNDVNVEGSGELMLFQNSNIIKGIWQKSGNGKLYFLDEEGEEIIFTPGQIWVEYVDMETEVKYE